MKRSFSRSIRTGLALIIMGPAVSISRAAEIKVAFQNGDRKASYVIDLKDGAGGMYEGADRTGRKLALSKTDAAFIGRRVSSILGQKSHELRLCPTTYVVVSNETTKRSRVACLYSAGITKDATKLVNALSGAFQFLATD